MYFPTFYRYKHNVQFFHIQYTYRQFSHCTSHEFHCNSEINQCRLYLIIERRQPSRCITIITVYCASCATFLCIIVASEISVDTFVCMKLCLCALFTCIQKCSECATFKRLNNQRPSIPCKNIKQYLLFFIRIRMLKITLLILKGKLKILFKIQYKFSTISSFQSILI